MIIAICEENRRDAVRLRRLLERYRVERQLEMDVRIYNTGEELLRSFSPGGAHILLLDVAFANMKGVEIAKRLRAANPDCAIIFTAQTPALAAQSYSVRAAHYLVKPVGYELFTVAMSRCEKQIQQFSKYIEVTENRVPVRILLRDIQYVEVYGRSCHIRTDSGIVTTNLTIEELAKLLGSDAFVRCHRSYLVNLSRVTQLGKDAFILDSGEQALISRRMHPVMQKAYNEFTRAHMQTDILEGDGSSEETQAWEALFVKEIKLFLASTLHGMDKDIEELSSFIGDLNKRYIRQGVYFSLNISGEGTEEDDLEKAESCDLFYMIFEGEPKGRAKAEYEAALAAFKKHKSPKIVAYCKGETDEGETEHETGDDSETGDSSLSCDLPRDRQSIEPPESAISPVSSYTHIDTIKLSIVLQLKSLGLEHAKIDIEKDSLTLDGKALMTLGNIPVMFNSRNLAAMKAEHTELEKEYWELRERIRENPDDAEAQAEYLKISERKNEADNSMYSLQMDILAMETSFLEKVGAGYTTPRLMQARRLFEAGDLKSAKQLLDIDEMLREDGQTDDMLGEMQKKKLAKVSEYLYLADMLKTDLGNPERFDAIERAYEQAFDIEVKYNLSKRPAAREYVKYLEHHKKSEKAVVFARRHLNWLENEESGTIATANWHSLMALNYSMMNRFSDADEMCTKAIDILKRAVEEGAATVEPALAENYMLLSESYLYAERYTETEETCKKALLIFKRLAAEEPELYESYCAKVGNILALTYLYTKRYSQARELFSEVISIDERLAVANPAEHEHELAMSYNNMALVHMYTRHHEDAERFFMKALAIDERLATENPAAYEPTLANNHNNMAAQYFTFQQYEKAEEHFIKAVAIFERLTVLNTATFEPDFAMSMCNLARTYHKIQRYDEAETLHKKALSIREQHAKDDAAVFKNDLAISLQYTADLYKSLSRYAESEELYKRALDIYETMVTEEPEAFEPDLARVLTDFADLYALTGRLDEAKKFYHRALNIYERVAAAEPDAYEQKLKDTQTALAELGA